MALVDRSGAVVVGGTAQSLLVANVTRNGFSVQNNSVGDLWVNEVGADAVASEPSIKIAAGTTYTTPLHSPCPAAASIFGATTGQAFTCREW